VASTSSSGAPPVSVRPCSSVHLPHVPVVNLFDYCEYYFAAAHRDLTYRVDLPPVEPAPFYPRCINAATLTNLVASDAAYALTRWQRDSFPARFAARIEVHFDGIDTELYRPGPGATTLAGEPLPADVRVVTFVARGLESMRGFDLFARLAGCIGRARPDVRFVVVGDDRAYYGWDAQHTGGVPFKQWALERADCDPSRFVFLGHVAQQRGFVRTDNQGGIHKRFLEHPITCDVVGVAVGVEDRRHRQALVAQAFQNEPRFQSRIDDQGVGAPTEPHQVGVLLEGQRHNSPDVEGCGHRKPLLVGTRPRPTCFLVK
jgi:glycosyltransferase involved in cell wall biosynthesis